MGVLENIALVYAALLVVTRLPAVISPNWFKKSMMPFLKRHFRIMGGLALVAALAILYFVFQKLSVAEVVATAFAAKLLLGAWFASNPDVIKQMYSLMEKKGDAWVRWNAAIALAIGLLVAYFVLYG